MSSVLTTAHFQSDMKQVFEKVLETGIPLKIGYKGATFVRSGSGLALAHENRIIPPY